MNGFDYIYAVELTWATSKYDSSSRTTSENLVNIQYLRPSFANHKMSEDENWTEHVTAGHSYALI